MKKLQKPAKTSRRAWRSPTNEGRKVSVEFDPQAVVCVIEMRGECAEYLENLVAAHGGELGRDSQDILFLNRENAETLQGLALPIEFRVNGRAWVLRNHKGLGWFLDPVL